MIKKNIIIILISAAIAAAIVFTDNVISADRLEDLSPKSEESINNNAGDNAADTDIIEDGKKVLAGANEDSDDKSSVEAEAAAEESGDESDIESQEDIQADPDSGQAEIAASNDDNVETVPDENVEDNWQPALDEKNIDYSDSENFRIEVDLARQRVIVFYKDDILREMVCSGGAPGSPTPPGEFVTLQKIEYSFIERFDVGAYYWIRFFKDYLIHSVPFDEEGNMIIEEFEKLGSPASHGCIRLKLEEAKWLYETIPLGVKVWIY